MVTLGLRYLISTKELQNEQYRKEKFCQDETHKKNRGWFHFHKATFLSII